MGIPRALAHRHQVVQRRPRRLEGPAAAGLVVHLASLPRRLSNLCRLIPALLHRHPDSLALLCACAYPVLIQLMSSRMPAIHHAAAQDPALQLSLYPRFPRVPSVLVAEVGSTVALLCAT